MRKDVRKLAKDRPGDSMMRATLIQAALTLARAIDALGVRNPSTLGKLVDSLRVTMGELAEVAADDGDSDQAQELASRMASAVRDPAK